LAEIPFAPLAASNNNNNKSDDEKSTKVVQQEIKAEKSTNATSSIGTYKLVVQRFFSSIREAIKKLLSKLLAIFHSRKE